MSDQRKLPPIPSRDQRRPSGSGSHPLPPSGPYPAHAPGQPISSTPYPAQPDPSYPHPHSSQVPVNTPATRAPTVASSSQRFFPDDHATGGLKIVTISPGNPSQPDGGSGMLQLPPDSRPLPRSHDPYLGCTIDGRYKVEQVLGEGGMGVVYRCTHKIIGKKVAMKVLRADLARDREVTERFLNEAKSASAIGNPHIIDISDFGQLPDGSTYFVMEYLDGNPLSKLVESGPVPVPRILHIARQLSEGLSAAHGAGIVHRDLKPDNIFSIQRGQERDFVKILDFGIAKVTTSGEGKLTRAGAVFGTPHYMSPEQAAGAPVDHRGDIYSMGVILYEMASGKVPFDADNFMGILTQHMYKAPVPIRALVPQPQDVPPGLEAIVLKCLSKRPEQRYQSMDEVLADIDKLKQGLIPDAVPEMMQRSGGFNVPVDYFKKGGGMPAPVPATPTVPVVRTRWPLYAGLAGVAAAVGIVVAIFAASRSSDASISQPPPAAAAIGAPATPKPESTEPAAAPAPAKKQVVLGIEPIDAHAFLGDKDLGTSPVVVEIEFGATTTLVIKREGFRDKEVKLDDSADKLTVSLERIESARLRTPVPRTQPKAAPKAAPAPEPPSKTKTKGKTSIGGGEIVDPWSQ